MAEGREARIGSAIEALWGELSSIREGANWKNKLLTCSYMHHRDDYEGTLVERRVIYDTSAIQYLETFLDGFIGYMMPMDDTWLSLLPVGSGYGPGADAKRYSYTMPGDLDRVRGLGEYLERCVSALMTVFASTDFYGEAYMAAKDYFITGTGYMLPEGTVGDGGICYRCYDPQEVCLAEDHNRRPNVFLRKFTMDARDIVRAYPDKEWERLRYLISRGSGERSDVDCFEAILPRDYLHAGGEALTCGNGKRYAHLMYVQEEKALAFEAGFGRFPVSAARRRRTNAKTPYGRGVCEEYLTDIIELNDMARIRQVMRQKNADPPMTVPYSLEGAFSSRPGARNYVSDMSSRPVPVLDHYDANELLADIQDKRNELMTAFSTDIFRIVMNSVDSRKTAYEVSEMKNEKITLLQMLIGSFKREFVTPIVKRTLAILHDAGVIEDPPAGRDGKGRMDFDTFLAGCSVELDSVFVRRAQSYLQYQQSVQSMQILATLSQIFPGASLNVKENSYTRRLLYGAGTPAADIRDLRDVEADQESMREEMQRQQRIQEQQGQAAALSEIAKAGGALNAGGQAV